MPGGRGGWKQGHPPAAGLGGHAAIHGVLTEACREVLSWMWGTVRLSSAANSSQKSSELDGKGAVSYSLKKAQEDLEEYNNIQDSTR